MARQWAWNSPASVKLDSSNSLPSSFARFVFHDDTREPMKNRNFLRFYKLLSKTGGSL